MSYIEGMARETIFSAEEIEQVVRVFAPLNEVLAILKAAASTVMSPVSLARTQKGGEPASLGEFDKAPCSECGNLSLIAIGRRRRRVFLDVSRERDEQTKKFGEQRHAPLTWMAILGEEVGEANRSALHDRFGGEAAGTLRTELVQVAAVAVAILELIDQDELKAPQRGGVEHAIPEWLDEVPWCCESCPSHDGKRCAILRSRAPEVCLPTVKVLGR